MNDKIETYIGFAIKKGSVAFGVDGIKACRKHIFVILYTDSLSEGSRSALEFVAEKRGVSLLKIDDYQTLTRKNCKALAICDKSLAQAIESNLK